MLSQISYCALSYFFFSLKPSQIFQNSLFENLFLFSKPPASVFMVIGSPLYQRSPPLSKFCLLPQKKSFLNFKNQLCISPKESHFFQKLLHPYFNSPNVIFNNTQKSFFPSQSLTNFKTLPYLLVDFPIKPSNY